MLKPVTSNLVVPLHLTRGALNDALVRSLPTVLLEDADFAGRGIALKVKLADAAQLDVIDTNAPEGITVRLGLTLGIEVAKATMLGRVEAGGTLRLVLQTEVQLAENWALTSITHVHSHKWLQRPELSLGGIGFGVGKLSSLILERVSARATKRIDDDLRAKAPLRTALSQLVERLTGALPMPPELGGDLYVELLALGIHELRRASDGGIALVAQANFTVRALLGVVAESAGSVSGTPTELPEQLDSLETQPEFSVHASAVLGHTWLAGVLAKAVVGKQFERAGVGVSVVGVNVVPFGRKLRISLQLKGSVTATVSIASALGYDADGDHVVMYQPDVSIDTDSFFARAAIWALGKRIATVVAQQVAVQSGAELQKLRGQLAATLEGDTSISHVELAGVLHRLDVVELSYGDEGVRVSLVVQGKVAVAVL